MAQGRLRRFDKSRITILCTAICLIGIVEEFFGQVTVAIRLLVEIVLMVFFGREVILQRLTLHNDALADMSLLLGKNAVDDYSVLFVDVIDTSSVACTMVVALLVQAGGVNSYEEEVE